MWIKVKGTPVNLDHFVAFSVEPVIPGLLSTNPPVAYRLLGKNLVGGSATLFEGKTAEECREVFDQLISAMQLAGAFIDFSVWKFGTDA